jgi:hypothetical protein
VKLRGDEVEPFSQGCGEREREPDRLYAVHRSRSFG